MKTMLHRSGLWFALLTLVGTGLAADPNPPSATITAAAAFAQMKSLVGEWTGTMKEGSEELSGARMTYRLTGAGSALVETLGPGSPHEMLTVYHMDGERLLMTHYCAAGNQPRMMLSAASTPQSLDFQFAGATNLKSEADQHMRSLRIRFIDADHLEAEWVSFKDGKPGHTAVFTWVRVK